MYVSTSVALGLEVREPGVVRPPVAEQLAVLCRDREPVVVQYSTVQYSTVQYSTVNNARNQYQSW